MTYYFLEYPGLGFEDPEFVTLQVVLPPSAPDNMKIRVEATIKNPMGGAGEIPVTLHDVEVQDLNYNKGQLMKRMKAHMDTHHKDVL